jgi:hypothetical protein
MDRSILYAQEQGRSYDFLSVAREFLRDFGFALADLLGSSGTMASGLAATATSPASLVVNLAAGRVYQWAVVDATQYGTLGQDYSYTMQQGIAAAQALTFSTSSLSSGQSCYALVQAKFTQTDIIPTDDPNNGVLPYFNANNPANPFSGPGGTGAPQNTRRTGVCSISIKYGAPATTGSQVAPSPDAGFVGLYIVNLSYGQTQIAQNQIALAPNAPFLAGLLNAHHSGGAGQAPKVDLTSEVQHILPLSNLPGSSTRSGGGIAVRYTFAGNPNGHVAGTAAVAGVSPPDECTDTTTGALWVCTTSGTATSAVWAEPLPVVNSNPGTFGDSTHDVSVSVTAQGLVTGASQSPMIKGSAWLYFTVSSGSIASRSGSPPDLVNSLARTGDGTFTIDASKVPAGVVPISMTCGTPTAGGAARIPLAPPMPLSGTTTFTFIDVQGNAHDPSFATIVFGKPA